jgi:cyclic pyranopterin phosphate synthase
MFIARAAPLRKLRLTGGEPLLRRDLSSIIRRFAQALPETELCLTTNGLLLSEQAFQLRAAGLNRINVSLDTTDAVRFSDLTGGGDVLRVEQGIRAAFHAGFRQLKINSVLMRSYNWDFLSKLVGLASKYHATIRFIELMPCGQAATMHRREFVSGREALSALTQHFNVHGPLQSRGTADEYLLTDGDRECKVGFIKPVSEPFCSGCDRLRMDCRGWVYPCLREDPGIDLRELVETKGSQVVESALVELFQQKQFPSEGWSSRSMITIGG